MLGRDEGSGAISRFAYKGFVSVIFMDPKMRERRGGGRTCQFSPAIRASSRSSIFSRFLALLESRKFQLCDVSTQRTKKGGGWGGLRTVPSHSYISRFLLVYPEAKVQDSCAPSGFPGAFLLADVGRVDLEELEP